MVKSFYVTCLDYGIVSVDIPEGATEQEEKDLVIRAEQHGEAYWYNREIADVSEAGVDSLSC